MHQPQQLVMLLSHVFFLLIAKFILVLQIENNENALMFSFLSPSRLSRITVLMDFKVYQNCTLLGYNEVY